MSHPRPPVLRRFYEGEHPGGTNWSPPGARQSPPVGSPQFPRGPFHDPMDDRPPYPGNFPWDVQKSCIPDRPGGAPGPRHRHGPQRSRKRLPKPAAKVVKPLSKPTTSVSVWTVQVGEETFSYCSRIPWKNQMRGTRGTNVGGPFKGNTLDDRHPKEPKAVYTEEELSKLCPVCGTLVVHWDTHETSQLHQIRERDKNASMPQEPTQIDVVAALRVLQATRPDVLAASLAVASPGLLQAATQLAMVPPPNLGHALGDGPTPLGGTPPVGPAPQQATPMRGPCTDDSYEPPQKYARGEEECGGEGNVSNEASGSTPWKLPRIELSSDQRHSPQHSPSWN